MTEIRLEQAEVLGFQDAVLQDALTARRAEIETTLKQMCAERQELTSKPPEDHSHENQRHRHRQFVLSKEIEAQQNQLDQVYHTKQALTDKLAALEQELAKEAPEEPEDFRLAARKNQITRQEMKLQEVLLMNKEYKEIVSLFDSAEIHERMIQDATEALRRVREEYKQQSEAREDIAAALQITREEYENVKRTLQLQQQSNKKTKDAKRIELRELHAEREQQGNNPLLFDDLNAYNEESPAPQEVKLMATKAFEDAHINPEQFLQETKVMLKSLEDEVVKKLQQRASAIDAELNEMKAKKTDSEIPLVVSYKKFDDSVRKIIVHRNYTKEKHAEMKMFYDSVINQLQTFLEKMQIIRPIKCDHFALDETEKALILHSCFGFEQLDMAKLSPIQVADLMCAILDWKLENCTHLCGQLTKSQVRMPTIEVSQDEVKEDDLGLDDSDDVPTGMSLQSIHNVRIQLPDLQPDDFQVDGLIIQRALSFRGMRQLLKNESNLKLAEHTSKQTSQTQ